MPRAGYSVIGLLVASGFVAASLGTATHASVPRASGTALDLPALAAQAALQPDAHVLTTRDHARWPEDRYAFAGGCYIGRSLASGGYLTRSGATFNAGAKAPTGAEALHFEPLDLGKYLLFGAKADFVSGPADPLEGAPEGAEELGRGYVKGTGGDAGQPIRSTAVGAYDTAAGGAAPVFEGVRAGLRETAVVAAAAPSAAAEWVVKPAGAGPYTYTLQMAVDDHDDATPGPVDPPIAGTLVAAADGTLAVAPGVVTGPAAAFVFELGGRCADWPEIGLNVSGPHAVGSTPYEQTHGYFDAHLHGMAFEFLGGRVTCGRPWHPYGVSAALVDCPDHTATQGRGAAAEQILSGQQPGEGHDTVGWPTFGFWPRYSSYTHQQVYYKWLERSWLGGLRLFTNLLVENGVLCQIYPLKKNSCNEMESVQLQAQRLHELERYIDAQAGGPGRGWFRIVYDPFEARRVINSGRLAVIMGIEVSVPLDCGEYLDSPQCTDTDVKTRMDAVYKLGVRQMELTNKFDNALTGVTGDDGIQGPIVNVGNRHQTGHFWKFHACDPEFAKAGRHDKTQYNLADESGGQLGRDAIFGAVLEASGETGVGPIYPGGPQCNIKGLSALGKTALTTMISHGMIFDPDHMSAIARSEALDFIAAHKYSGIISSHGWADDPTYASILRQGGLVAPNGDGSEGFVKDWRKLRAAADPRFPFAIGYGSDVNGFSALPPPRHPKPGQGVVYPFRGMGGVQINRQTSGKRTYDINTDGVPHYGLYPDWVKDATLVAGKDGAQFQQDMERGAEAYLDLWERAIGITGDSCRSDVPDLGQSALSKVRRGMTPEQVLLAVGQPHTRLGSTFTYCAGGGRVAVRFTRAGQVSAITRA